MQLFKSFVIAIFCLILGIFILGTIGGSLVHWFNAQTQENRTAIIGAIALITVPVVTYFTTKSIERTRSAEQAIRLQKVETYQKFIEFIMSMFVKTSRPKPTEEEIQEFFADITPLLITYASTEVIQLWGKYRVGLSKLATQAKNPIEPMLVFENILKAMRKDLGRSTNFAQKGDILRLFVNDVDEQLAVMKKKQ